MGAKCTAKKVTTEEYQREVARLTEISIKDFLHLPTSSGRQSRFQWSDQKRRTSLEPQEVIKISSNATPMEAFDTLAEFSIRAAPVYDPVSSNEYIGVLDVRDIVKYAVARNEFLQQANIDIQNLVPTCGSKVYALEDLEYEDEVVKKGTEGWVQEVDDEDVIVAFDHHSGAYPVELQEIHIVSLFEPLKDGSGRGMEIQVDSGITINKLARMRRFVCHSCEDSLASVMNDLSSGHHIIGITNASGEVFRIMGQSDIFSYLMKQSQKFNLPLSQYVNDTTFYGSPVAHLDSNVKAVEGFDFISKSGYSSTLVMNDKKALGVLSALDVREWLAKERTREIDICKVTVGAFVEKVKVKNGVVTCTLYQNCDTLFKLIKKNNLHRIFIKGYDNCIMGCLSITDFFKFALVLTSEGKRISMSHRRELKARAYSTRQSFEHDQHTDNLREKSRKRVNRTDSGIHLKSMNTGPGPSPVGSSDQDRMMAMGLKLTSDQFASDRSIEVSTSPSESYRQMMLAEEALLGEEAAKLSHDTAV